MEDELALELAKTVFSTKSLARYPFPTKSPFFVITTFYALKLIFNSTLFSKLLETKFLQRE